MLFKDGAFLILWHRNPALAVFPVTQTNYLPGEWHWGVFSFVGAMLVRERGVEQQAKKRPSALTLSL